MRFTYTLLALATLVLLGSFAAPDALAQALEVRAARDLPRDAQLADFQKRFLDQPLPPDSATLFQAIKDLQYLEQRLGEISTQQREVARASDYLNQFFTSTLIVDPTYCREDSTASGMYAWWGGSAPQVQDVLRQAAESIGVPHEPLAVAPPIPDAQETCAAYAERLSPIRAELQKVATERLAQYEVVEKEKLGNIPDVARVYETRRKQLNDQLEIVRKQGEDRRATSIAESLWLIFVVLGAIAMGILLIVRAFPDKAQLELVQSGQVIQFITVLLLLTVIMALGLSSAIQENTLGTLLGGLAGYVLSQGVGRVAEHAAEKAQRAKAGSSTADNPAE